MIFILLCSCGKDEIIQQPVTVIDTAYYYTDTTNLGDEIFVGWYQNMLVDSLSQELILTGDESDYAVDLNNDGLDDIVFKIENKTYSVLAGNGDVITYSLPETSVSALAENIELAGKLEIDSLFYERTNFDANNYGDYYTVTIWSWRSQTSSNTFQSRTDTSELVILEAFDVYGENDKFIDERAVLWVPDTSFQHVFGSIDYLMDDIQIRQSSPLIKERDVYLPFRITASSEKVLGWIKLNQRSDLSLMILETAIQNPE